MKTVGKWKWLWLVPLLILPVAAEMTINASGLPTPWPIGLIGTLASFWIIYLQTHENFS